jgi:deoxyribonuclease-4
MHFGSHCSTAGGVLKALERAAFIGADVCQVFVKNNMQWFGKAAPDGESTDFKVRSAKLACVFGHSGYLINLGGPASENRDKSIRSLVQELDLAAQLGLPFLVLHPGSHLGQGEEAGLAQIVSGLDEALAATKNLTVRVALENTAGQGTCLGNRFEHIAAIYSGVKTPARLAMCIDTAHLFAAGFDVRTPQGWDEVMDQITRLVGIEQIAAFHLNDSKSGLDSRVDRHEHIGKGKIGLEAFRHIVNDPRFAQTPGCIETPKSADLREDIENLRALRSLVRS